MCGLGEVPHGGGCQLSHPLLTDFGQVIHPRSGLSFPTCEVARGCQVALLPPAICSGGLCACSRLAGLVQVGLPVLRPAEALAPSGQPVDSELSGSLVQKRTRLATRIAQGTVVRLPCKAHVAWSRLLRAAPARPNAQGLVSAADRQGSSGKGGGEGAGWADRAGRASGPSALLEKFMGHLREGHKAGWPALPPLLPWNAMFIYGSLFLWEGHLCQGWGKLTGCLQRNLHAPLPLVTALGDQGVAAGDALGEGEGGSCKWWG